MAWSIVLILLLFNLPFNFVSEDSVDKDNSNYGHQTTEYVDNALLFTSQRNNRGNEPVSFENVALESNITNFRSDSFAWGDYNNDGYLDFLSRGNLSTGTRLFRNNGPPSWNFSDISTQLNLTGSGINPNRGYPIWGDYNNDGYLDFFVAGDHDQLWKNSLCK